MPSDRARRLRRSPVFTAILSSLVACASLHIRADPSAPIPNGASASQRPPSQASEVPNGAAPSDLPIPQITIRAQREAIEPRVRAFVNGTLDVDWNDGLARWKSPVCPAVIGLTHDEGEFILARLSQIARTAGVPLDGEHCAPNLDIVVTQQPAKFLRQWGKNEHWRMFDAAAVPSAINAFIDTPRSVRVWYNSKQVSADGMNAFADVPLGVSAGANSARLPGFRAPVGDSRITRPVTQSLTSAIVVVDKPQLKGVTREQLADYIAMVAFSQLKATPHHGDAPTILGLFDREAAPPPANLTSWDEALLESLYHTDPRLVMQKAAMVRRMVQHIVPESPTTR